MERAAAVIDVYECMNASMPYHPPNTPIFHQNSRKELHPLTSIPVSDTINAVETVF